MDEGRHHPHRLPSLADASDYHATQFHPTARLKCLPVNKGRSCAVNPRQNCISFGLFHPSFIPSKILEGLLLTLEHERHATSGLDEGA